MNTGDKLKEIIERRRQWGETRDSDFDCLIQCIVQLNSENEYLKSRNKDYRTWLDYYDKGLREISKEGIGYGQRVAKETLEGLNINF